jgi:septal ring factor EnvC (AmiA/AmiB activator)
MRPSPLIPLAAVALALAPGVTLAQRDPGALRSEQRAREAERDQLRADAAQLRAEVARLRRELLQLGAAQADGERKVGGERSRLEQLNARETALRARMARTKIEQARLLGALQMYSRHPPPALFVSPGSAKDAVRAAILMRAVAPELKRRADAFATETAAITRVRREAAAASEALFTAESTVADRRGRIEQLMVEKSALERSLLLDAEQAEAEARALAAQAGSLGDLVGDVRGRSPALAAPAPTRLVPPVEGELTRGFGDPGEGERSRGLFFETEPNAQVRSPADARVQFAGVLKGYGVVLILRAGGAYDLILAGLETAAPPPGGRVAAGEPIGRMAASSRPQPELYLEVRRNGVPVDPARLLQPRPEAAVLRAENFGLRGAVKPPG